MECKTTVIDFKFVQVFKNIYVSERMIEPCSDNAYQKEIRASSPDSFRILALVLTPAYFALAARASCA